MKPIKAYEHFEEKLPNHVFIHRVAEAAGVTRQSVHRVARKRLKKEGKRDRKRLDGCPYTFVSLDLWDDYMQIGHVPRVAKRPKGWVTAKALVQDGFSRRKLYELLGAGELESVYVGKTLYFEPEGAKRYQNLRRELKPPPGWVSVVELRKQARRSKQALSTYLKIHNIETKQFLHPERDQLIQYICSEAAETYLAGVFKNSPKKQYEEILQPENVVQVNTTQPEHSQTALDTYADNARAIATDTEKTDTEKNALRTSVSHAWQPPNLLAATFQAEPVSSHAQLHSISSAHEEPSQHCYFQGGAYASK
jgi:hypothetical protein